MHFSKEVLKYELTLVQNRIVMTREEIIKKAAAEHRDIVCCGFDDPIADAQEESFIEGAEWEHKRLVEKACEWIDDVDISKYLSCIFSGAVNISFISDGFIRDFKKAME